MKSKLLRASRIQCAPHWRDPPIKPSNGLSWDDPWTDQDHPSEHVGEVQACLDGHHAAHGMGQQEEGEVGETVLDHLKEHSILMFLSVCC